MMTQELNVCVLAAPLAAIDRRTLSQAWYSALHCASGQVTQTVKKPKTGEAAHERTQSTTHSVRRERHGAGAARRTLASREKMETRDSYQLSGDRRARRSELARRIERKFLDPRATARRATFSTSGKRVHVVVQASAGRVRLVAVCAPVIREAVARALAQARFALASRGVACF